MLLLLQPGFGLRRRESLDEEWKHPSVQGIASSHDAPKEFRSGSHFRVLGQGFWVKTRPNVSVPARTSPRRACSMRGQSCSRLLSSLLLLPELFSPDRPYHTHPVPRWVRGTASAGTAKRVNRLGEGSRLGDAGCPGTGSSRGTRGTGILGEVPAPHALCFLMCLSSHQPVTRSDLSCLKHSGSFKRKGLRFAAFPLPAGQVLVSPGQGIQRILGRSPSIALANGGFCGSFRPGLAGKYRNELLPFPWDPGWWWGHSLHPASPEHIAAPVPAPPPRCLKTPKSREPGAWSRCAKRREQSLKPRGISRGFLLCRPRVTQPWVTWWPVVVLYQHPARAGPRPAPRGQGCSPPPWPQRCLPGPVVPAHGLVSAWTVAPGWSAGSGHVSPLPVPDGTGHPCRGSWQHPSTGD